MALFVAVVVYHRFGGFKGDHEGVVKVRLARSGLGRFSGLAVDQKTLHLAFKAHQA